MKGSVIAAAVVALRQHHNSLTHGFVFGIDGTKPPESLLFSCPEEYGSSALTPGDAQTLPVVCTATLDYSAVNEYVHAQCQQSAYFTHDRVEQQIYDARVRQTQHDDERDMLVHKGLVIIELPLQNPVDWTDADDTQSHTSHNSKR
jgi:hypothetical protein